MASRIGRKKIVSADQVLEVIRRHQTRSVTELARLMNTSRVTVNKRIKEIDPEEIDKIFRQIAETELKPSEMDLTVFEQIPEVKQYMEKLLYKAEVSERYARQRLLSLFHICCALKRHPRGLTLEECAELVLRVKRKEILYNSVRGLIPLGLESTKKTIRSWFEVMHRLSSQALTSEGVDGAASPGTGKKSESRFTMEQRHAFMEVVREKVKSNWRGTVGKTSASIPFGDDPDLALRMLVLPKAYYYWGNRKAAVLDALIQDMQWGRSFGSGTKKIVFGIQKLIDKGRHKTGRSIWHKDTVGELLQEMKQLFEWLGKPTQGKWFPFTKSQLRVFFVSCYKEAGIPASLFEGMSIHIWRHTACQDLLEATNYNFEKVAAILSWKSVDTMKKCYGTTPPAVRRKVLFGAMGFKVVWEKREFKF